MTEAIGSLGALSPSVLPVGRGTFVDKPATGSTQGFQELLMRSIGDVGAMEQQAHTGVLESLTGSGDLTQVEALSALKKADLALRLMLQIRNKILDAYQEIQQMRM